MQMLIEMAMALSANCEELKCQNEKGQDRALLSIVKSLTSFSLLSKILKATTGTDRSTIKSQVWPEAPSVLGFDLQIQIEAYNVLKFTSCKQICILILPYLTAFSLTTMGVFPLKKLNICFWIFAEKMKKEERESCSVGVRVAHKVCQCLTLLHSCGSHSSSLPQTIHTCLNLTLTTTILYHRLQSSQINTNPSCFTNRNLLCILNRSGE